MEVIKQQPLVTVIIPFYKGEKYIIEAVDSVLKQSYKNVEVLLINDGSPTGDDVCRKIANSDSRVRYYKKENEGAGKARNFGISKAKGDIIAFLDADDIWVNNFLTEKTINDIMAGGDIIGFSYGCCSNNLKRVTFVRVRNETIKGGGAAAQECRNGHTSLFYKKKIFSDSDIRYASSRRNEDVIMIQKALYVAQTITYIDKVVFLYRNNYSSETHSKLDPVLLYGPLLVEWRNLLRWHIEKHPDDLMTINNVRHMIGVYAMEGVEALYQTGIDEESAERLVDKYFCRDYLDNYRNIMLSQNRIDQIGFYYNNRSTFIAKQRKIGRKIKINNFLKKFKVFQKMNDKKKYSTDTPPQMLWK